MYFFETNYNWDCDPSFWETIQKTSLDAAIRILDKRSNLARCIWPMRVIDEKGHIYCVYDPEQDTRLPGCRWRQIRRNAYALWEQNGKPESDGVEFWLEAEATLEESNGVYEVNGHYEWTDRS